MKQRTEKPSVCVCVCPWLQNKNVKQRSRPVNAPFSELEQLELQYFKHHPVMVSECGPDCTCRHAKYALYRNAARGGSRVFAFAWSCFFIWWMPQLPQTPRAHMRTADMCGLLWTTAHKVSVYLIPLANGNVCVCSGKSNGSPVAKRRYFDDVPHEMLFHSTIPCQRPHSGLCCAD